MSNDAFAIQVKWDAAGLSKLDRYLETHEGKLLEKRIDSAIGKAVRPLAGQIRASEQRSGIHNQPYGYKTSKGSDRQSPGKLLSSIKARKPRKRPGEVSAWTVGPTARHAHLVIQGHRIVTPGGRDTGRRARAFPFVDPVIDREAAVLQSQLSSDVWAASTIK